MAILKAIQATSARGGYNSGHAGDLLTAVAEFDIAVDNGGTPIATADVIEMLELPAEHVLVDAILDTDAIAAGVVDVGLVGGTGAEIMAGKAIGTAAAHRADVAGFTRVPATDVHRIIALTVATGSAAIAGKIRLTIQYRATDHGL